MGALGGAITVDQKEAREMEKRMYEAKIDSGEIEEEASEHKRSPVDPEQIWPTPIKTDNGENKPQDVRSDS